MLINNKEVHYEKIKTIAEAKIKTISTTLSFVHFEIVIF